MRAIRRSFPSRLLLGLGLCAALLLPQIPAEAATSHTFYGGGWGHGVGMSQYGAYGMALKGWGPSKILRHYYRGVRVEQRTPPRRVYRVGLLQNRSQVTVTVVRGKLRFLLGEQVITTIGKGSRRVVVKDGRYRILKPGGGLVGGRTWPAKKPLRVKRLQRGVARVPEWGHSIGRGILLVHRASSSSAHVVVRVNAEKYLYGIAEVPSSWPGAVLQAQAIAARTYANRRVAAGRTRCACDIYADPRDQAYVGWTKEAGAGGSRWIAAVDASRGKVVTVGGQPASTLYSSSSGGFTENVENIWGGSPASHLKGTCDPGDFVSANPNRTWTLTLTQTQAADRLRARLGWNVSKVTSFVATKRGVSGRVVTMTVKGTRPNGTSFSASTSGWTLRGALGLKDSRFWVNQNLLVTGAIRGAYDSLGCAPGLATGSQQGPSGGRWQAFQKGRLYHNANRNFVGWIHGPVLTHYLSKGGPAGTFGLPRTSVARLADGTQKATFEGGTITCSPAGACS